MHSVLWGSLQQIRGKLPYRLVAFQCTLCFGVLFNTQATPILRRCLVSMHSVLWGSLQLPVVSIPVLDKSFNALCALGFSSTLPDIHGALPTSVSMHSVLWGSLQLCKRLAKATFGLVSMHSVLWGSLQHKREFFMNLLLSFNALCALGFSSTRCWCIAARPVVCFNALCALGFSSTFSPVHGVPCSGCFNALCALGFSSTRVGAEPMSREVFQCTLCFGVLFNKEGVVYRATLLVSMHSVLWGSLQLAINTNAIMRYCFNALCALGFSSTRFSPCLNNGDLSFNALCALGFSSTRQRVRRCCARQFQCTLCFGVLFNLETITS